MRHVSEKRDFITMLVRGNFSPETPIKKTADAVKVKGEFMKKAEKNYRRDYGHKSNEELALNYSRDSLKEELDGVLEKIAPDDLTADEQEYIDGRNQCRDHTLNIRFNGIEWEHICRQSELLKMKKSSYVRECAKESHFLMIDKNDMNNIIGAIRGLSANVNQVALRANKKGKIYDEDIADMKARLEEIWQLLNYIQSGVLCVDQLNTSWTGIRPEIMHFSELLCVRQNQTGQRSNSVLSESVSEVGEVPSKHST